MNPRTRASLALMAAARRPTGDPVADADHAAVMADLRAAVCLASGVSPADIGPGGYDHSAAGYARVRAGWVSHVRQWGIALFDNHLAQAFALWTTARPDLTAGDDWREAGAQAHKAAHPGGGCFYGDRCVICCPEPW